MNPVPLSTLHTGSLFSDKQQVFVIVQSANGDDPSVLLLGYGGIKAEKKDKGFLVTELNYRERTQVWYLYQATLLRIERQFHISIKR
ncbi:hypothetical protein HYW55_01150 [Candidatus Gottesmanbacteria bacterium]|nr:hypothetical protein [Candidatus Gottesmanbacteria bacterium]